MTGGRIGGVLASVALGALLALVLWAPAGWLAGVVAQATGQRLLLADARGTIWNGSAVAILTGGAGSRDASALPGRLQWRLRPGLRGLQLQATHACCINGTVGLDLRLGLGRLVLELQPQVAGGDGVLGQWPAAWLAGLGTPWNTLQPSGSLQLRSPGLVVERVQGRWRLQGQAELTVNAFASRLSTLEVLGSYTLVLSGAPAGVAGGAGATLQLATTSGALLLQGQGQWVGDRLRFSGEASAAPGSEAVLANLLNIIGRRQGERSVISIG
jgi:general secretion pathway protein N